MGCGGSAGAFGGENINKEENHYATECPPHHILHPPPNWPSKIRGSSPHIPKPSAQCFGVLSFFFNFPGNCIFYFPGK